MGVLLWISALILHAQKVDKAKLLAIYDRQFEFLDSLLKQQFVDPCVALRDFKANSPLHSRGDDITPSKGCETFFIENQGYLDWYALFEEAVNQKMRANILAVKIRLAFSGQVAIITVLFHISFISSSMRMAISPW